MLIRRREGPSAWSGELDAGGVGCSGDDKGDGLASPARVLADSRWVDWIAAFPPLVAVRRC